MPSRFVLVSREFYCYNAVSYTHLEDKINSIAEKRLREEIRRGVQTIQYQVVTLLTTRCV